LRRGRAGSDLHALPDLAEGPARFFARPPTSPCAGDGGAPLDDRTTLDPAPCARWYPPVVHRARPLLVVVGALLGGCSLFTSLGEYSGGARDAGAGDGATSGEDATDRADGGDARPPPDGARFCDGRASTLCMDFDEGTLEQTAVTIDTTGGGSLTIDDALSASAPRSLRARLGALPDPGHVFAKLDWQAQTAVFRPVRLEFDIRLEGTSWAGQGGNVSLFAVGLPGRHSQELFIGDGYAAITTNNNGEATYTGVSEVFSPNKWIHVLFEADFTPGLGSVRLWMNEAKVADVSGIAFVGNDISLVEIQIGMARYNAPTPALDVRYDNVVVELL
jgi:hypothetical protein